MPKTFAMLYLPFRKTKKMLILLFALIAFHGIFESVWKEKTVYKTVDRSRPVSIRGESPGRPNPIEVRANNTILNFLDIKLPEETAVLIYIGYFIIVTRIILLVQVVKKDSSDEIRSEIK